MDFPGDSGPDGSDDDQEQAPPPFTAGGRVPEEFEGTRIDLGDDLVERTATLVPKESVALEALPGREEAKLELETPTQVEDHLESARILVTENLLEEAKRILRRIILTDPRHYVARKMLDEIHDQELKQIFGEGPIEPRRRRTDRGGDELDASSTSSELVMRQLDRDLKLGVFDDGAGGEVSAGELSLFQNREELEKFGGKLDQDLAGSLARDRLDTGIAFLEMGLHDLAARQFKAASRDAEQRAGATGLLAYALILAGRPFEATMELDAVLGDTELPGELKTEFMYLMGRAHEGLGNPLVAHQWYERTREAAPRYRDTDERMAWISRQAGRPRRPQ